MTTDAKIGLLLALVFIVGITFVINGLPDFLNKTISSVERWQIRFGEITVIMGRFFGAL